MARPWQFEKQRRMEEKTKTDGRQGHGPADEEGRGEDRAARCWVWSGT